MAFLLSIAPVLLIGITHVYAQRLYEGEFCFQGTQFRCEKIENCPWASTAIKNGQQPTICSFIGSMPVVCCPVAGTPRPTRPPTQPPTRPTPTLSLQGNSVSKRKCKEYAQSVFTEEDSPVLLFNAGTNKVDNCAIQHQTLIVGGVNAMGKEFPHMVLVGYGNDRNRITWACGGSLISERFVLSAAHCSEPNGGAKWARVGELDLDSSKDEASPVTLRIVQRIDHPEYIRNKVYNDIALFKLENDVEFNAYVRPICLPDNRKLPTTVLATGWGHTEWGGKSSKDLKKVMLKFTNNTECRKTYKVDRKNLPQGIVARTQVCAGDDGKDTCQGDSGGPLQITLLDPYCMYMQIGITSFGKACGNNYPGVYTRILPFVPWIEGIVWPN